MTKSSLECVTNTILGALNTGFGDIRRVQEQQQEQIRVLNEEARREAAKRSQQVYDLELKFNELTMQPLKPEEGWSRGSGEDAAAKSFETALRRDRVIPEDPYPIPGHDVSAQSGKSFRGSEAASSKQEDVSRLAAKNPSRWSRSLHATRSAPSYDMAMDDSDVEYMGALPAPTTPVPKAQKVDVHVDLTPKKQDEAQSRKRSQEDAVWASQDAWASSMQATWAKRRVDEITNMEVDEAMKIPGREPERRDAHPPQRTWDSPQGPPTTFAPNLMRETEAADGDSESEDLPAIDIPMPKFAHTKETQETKSHVESHAVGKPYINDAGILVFSDPPSGRTISPGFWQERTRSEIAILEARSVLRAAGAENLIE